MMDLWLPPKPAIIRPAEADMRRDWRRKPAKEANFAPGWFPAGAIAPVVRQLSFIASTTANATSIALPASIQAGDLLIYGDIARDSSPPSAVTPTGFTNMTNEGAFSTRLMTHYRFADGTESGLTRTGMTGTTSRNAKIVLQFRANQALSGVSPQSLGDEVTNGNPNQQTITASGGTAPVVLFAFYGCMGNVTNSGNVSVRDFSPAQDAEVSVGTTFYAKYKIINPADTLQNHTVDMTDDNGDQGLASGYLQPTFA